MIMLVKSCSIKFAYQKLIRSNETDKLTSPISSSRCRQGTQAWSVPGLQLHVIRLKLTPAWPHPELHRERDWQADCILHTLFDYDTGVLKHAGFDFKQKLIMDLQNNNQNVVTLNHQDNVNLPESRWVSLTCHMTTHDIWGTLAKFMFTPLMCHIAMHDEHANWHEGIDLCPGFLKGWSRHKCLRMQPGMHSSPNKAVEIGLCRDAIPTWSSILHDSAGHCCRSCLWSSIIASLTRSAALPWHTVFTACRSAWELLPAQATNSLRLVSSGPTKGLTYNVQNQPRPTGDWATHTEMLIRVKFLQRLLQELEEGKQNKWGGANNSENHLVSHFWEFKKGV